MTAGEAKVASDESRAKQEAWADCLSRVEVERDIRTAIQEGRYVIFPYYLSDAYRKELRDRGYAVSSCDARPRGGKISWEEA